MLATHPPTLTGTFHVCQHSPEDLCAAVAEYWTFARVNPSDPLSWDLAILAQALAEEITRSVRNPA